MIAEALPLVKTRSHSSRTSRGVVPVLRQATQADAADLHALITAHRDEGRLLPRRLDELAAHAPRFVVAFQSGRLMACAELAPLSPAVAEVRSLVVDEGARGMGLGRRLVDALGRDARIAGFEQLCAFTHEPGYFIRLGFSVVPHARVPEKIAQDCQACALFPTCGQHAVVMALPGRQSSVQAGAVERVS